jgi:predicted metal-dependent hydrolase
MPASWNGTLSTGHCELLSVEGLGWPLEMRVHPRARRLKLMLDERNERVRLTRPPRVSRRAALEWAGGQREWVAAQLARRESSMMLSPGAVVPFDGGELLLEWRDGESRTVRHETGLLWCGGPRDGFERRIGRWLKAEALRRLSAETADIASAAGIAVASVAVGDAVSRWGSCSADGRIRYNWRLLLASPEVRRYVVAHEVAHRRHMDHGDAFHRVEERLFGGPVSAARAELRRSGPRLKRVRLG